MMATLSAEAERGKGYDVERGKRKEMRVVDLDTWVNRAEVVCD